VPPLRPQALAHPSTWAFIRPVVTALALLCGIGAIAVYLMPLFLRKALVYAPARRRVTCQGE
jgi:hypothetical protein